MKHVSPEPEAAPKSLAERVAEVKARWDALRQHPPEPEPVPKAWVRALARTLDGPWTKG
jgi:hypothetical protein